MARKTIYVRDEDIQNFKRAEEIATAEKTSVSVVISKAIADYIKEHEAQSKGFEKIRLDIGSEYYGDHEAIDTKTVVFWGKLLSSVKYVKNACPDSNSYSDYSLYLTSKKNYLIHVLNFRPDDDLNISSYAAVKSLHELEEMHEYHIPKILILKARKALNLDEVEVLDF